MIKIFSLVFFLLFVSFTYSQNFLDADATGDAYTRITSKLFAYEVPDCVHPIPHITEEWNTDLKKYAFIFGLHVTPDNDRCINFDRQRTEMKTYDASPDSMKGFYGETITFRWKFKLDAGFQPSSSFTHIHQLKPGDGPLADNPQVTLTAVVKSSANKLQIRFGHLAGDGSYDYVYVGSLTPLLGVWVEATEIVKYDSVAGTYNLIIKRVDNEQVLVNFNTSNVAMWRTGSTFIRPKWGIYRSLDHPEQLRDEFIRFDDFSMDKGTLVNLPLAPSVLSTSLLSGGRIRLTWTDNSLIEDQFRIDRSTNRGTTWAYYAPAPKNSTTYTDTVTATNTYYYRVRAENTFGNSPFSNISSYYYIQSVQLSLTALIEGLYNGASMVSNTVTVELHNASSPYALVESQTSSLSTTGVGTFTFTTAVNGTPYYIGVKTWNTAETWSKTAQSFISGSLSYDFTTAQTQAYGDNLTQLGTKWCIFSGDVNQDGFVNLSDYNQINNDSYNLVNGVVVTDLNGDLYTNLADYNIVNNNSYNLVKARTPLLNPAAGITKPINKINRQIKSDK